MFCEPSDVLTCRLAVMNIAQQQKLASIQRNLLGLAHIHTSGHVLMGIRHHWERMRDVSCSLICANALGCSPVTGV